MPARSLPGEGRLVVGASLRYRSRSYHRLSGQVFHGRDGGRSTGRAGTTKWKDSRASLQQAIRNDSRYGSPVYQHLPGLVPPVWNDVQIPKARFFLNLRDEWADRVRLALEKDRPGNILTLAHDVPSRVERSQVLFTAAKALIGLCRYDAAEQILRDTLSLDRESQRRASPFRDCAGESGANFRCPA